MRTKLISFLLAASLAATAGLSPAQAQSFDQNAQRNAAALVFGLATLAIIAKAAEDQRERDKKKKRQSREEERKREAQRKARHDPVITRSERPLPRVYPHGSERPRAHGRVLSVPSRCARRVQTEQGVRTAFGAPCLQESGVNIARLPDRCERLADVGPRDIRIWGARCLRRNGVRID